MEVLEGCYGESVPTSCLSRITIHSDLAMKFLPAIGRVLFSIVFLMFGMAHFTDTQNMLASGAVPGFLPMPTLVIYITGVVIVLGGVGVLLGFKTREAAQALAVMMLATSLLTWAPQLAEGGVVAMGNFLKDLALAGGALMISHFGPGPMSMDARASDA